MASSFISSSPFTQYHPSSFQIPTSTVTMPYFTITTTFSNFPAAVTGGLTSTCHRIPAMVSTDHCLMCSIGACTTQRSPAFFLIVTIQGHLIIVGIEKHEKRGLPYVISCCRLSTLGGGCPVNHFARTIVGICITSQN
uniref:Uncharacterized protein n=1 Tax=Opuntia streptacantha TaxID=393608 RepID=A0A7C9D8I3_OPUST